ncbi:MAG TPA: ABC transporter substrate-binding protein [Candidatus Binatia bacterium]|nr:ABC transporter substrate-binding protein [Candidatus Binatia bacterium]
MRREIVLSSLGLTLLFAAIFVSPAAAQAPETFRVSYGGYNETAAPMWVGIEKGIFKKYGIDASMIQVRSGALSVAALVAKEVDAVWPAQSTILSTVFGGIKLGCIASAINKIPRLLIVRKDISSVEDLRGKVVGVQSIGGGFWLQTMIIFDAMGIDPDKHGLKFRVIGDGPVIAQALTTGNIDVAAMTYSLSDAALKAGFRSMVDASDIKAPYQGPSMCALKEVLANRQDFFLRLTKGLAESTAYILDSGNKPDVVKSLMKNLRLAKAEEGESSYKVLRLMTTLDLAPNPAAFKIVQRIVAKVNPKIAQVDIDQIIDGSYVRNLESSGFLPELRRKIR